MGIFDRRKDPPRQDEWDSAQSPGQTDPDAQRPLKAQPSAWVELEDAIVEGEEPPPTPVAATIAPPESPAPRWSAAVAPWGTREESVPATPDYAFDALGDRLAASPEVDESEPAPMAPPVSALLFFPAAPETLEEAGLSAPFVQDHIVRLLYFSQQLTGAQVADECGLPFTSIIQILLEALRREQLLEVKGQRGVGDAAYIYALTARGTTRALEALQKSLYRGPLPVPLDRYIAAVKLQTIRNVVVTEDNIKAAFSDLIIDPQILDQVGPAVNSASAMFLFGYPGNGKTSIAERITNLLGDSVYIPAAVEVDGQVVKLFDSLVHDAINPKAVGQDNRWVRIRRPIVIAGGELTLASLDLLWNDVSRFYEAPLQMKANLGMFLIDDFGRQPVRPQDLLNRWIVPLEKRIDYLTLVTGKKLQIPFDQLIVFSTNLDPEDLVDEAFLRRIKFKIDVKDPSLDQFTEIMQLMCRVRHVPFNVAGMDHMLGKWWTPSNRSLRMCQPRDILDQMIAIAKYLQVAPDLANTDLIDRACGTYFVSARGTASRVAV